MFQPSARASPNYSILVCSYYILAIVSTLNKINLYNSLSFSKIFRIELIFSLLLNLKVHFNCSFKNNHDMFLIILLEVSILKCWKEKMLFCFLFCLSNFWERTMNGMQSANSKICFFGKNGNFIHFDWCCNTIFWPEIKINC